MKNIENKELMIERFKGILERNPESLLVLTDKGIMFEGNISDYIALIISGLQILKDENMLNEKIANVIKLGIDKVMEGRFDEYENLK